MRTTVVGWDIGGVALKGAVAEGGRIVDAFRLTAPLWRGLETLEAAFDEALPRLPSRARHVLTLTGEVSDLFEDRAHGVESLVRLASRKLGDVFVYAGSRGFLSAEDAVLNTPAVASANWHATATLAAQGLSEGLLVDIGSTTTDLVPFAANAVAPVGETDADRLASGALLYTGATRTPVMAVCRAVPFGGRSHAIVAEHFADMADIRRLTGELAPDDGTDTADHRPASLPGSRARLARMIGLDASDAHVDAWEALARLIADRQLTAIFEAACLVLSRGDVGKDAPVIGAGAGRFLTQGIAHRLGRRHIEFETLVPIACGWHAAVSETAPASAVALLAEQL